MVPGPLALCPRAAVLVASPRPALRHRDRQQLHRGVVPALGRGVAAAAHGTSGPSDAAVTLGAAGSCWELLGAVESSLVP